MAKGNLNRRGLVMTGQIPPGMGPGTTFGPPRPQQPALTTLKRRGIEGTEKSFGRFDVDLSVARVEGVPGSGGTLRVGLSGNVLAVLKSTSELDEVEVRLDGRGPWLPIRVGQTISGQPFGFVLVKNAAQGTSVMVMVSATDVPGDRVLFLYR